MPNLREAVANVIMDGVRRNYTGFEGNGLYGGLMVDRPIDRGMYGCGSRRSRSKRSGSKRPHARRGAGKSNYMDFVKSWRRKNPGFSWKDAVRAASADYHHAAKSAASKMGLGVMAAGRRRVARPRVHRRRAGIASAGVMAAGRRRSGSKRSHRRR